MAREGVLLLTGAACFVFGGLGGEIAKVNGNKESDNITIDQLGCYNTAGCLSSWNETYILTNNAPGVCSQQCGNRSFSYFGLHNGSKCLCSCENPCGYETEESLCGVPCHFNTKQFCGGLSSISISKVNESDLNIRACLQHLPSTNDDDVHGGDSMLSVPFSIVIFISLIGLVIIIGGVLVCYCIWKNAKDTRRIRRRVRYDSSSRSQGNDSGNHRRDPGSNYSRLVSFAGKHHLHHTMNETSNQVDAVGSPDINWEERACDEYMDDLSAYGYTCIPDQVYSTHDSTPANSPSANSKGLNVLAQGISTSRVTNNTSSLTVYDTSILVFRETE